MIKPLEIQQDVDNLFEIKRQLNTLLRLEKELSSRIKEYMSVKKLDTVVGKNAVVIIQEKDRRIIFPSDFYNAVDKDLVKLFAVSTIRIHPGKKFRFGASSFLGSEELDKISCTEKTPTLITKALNKSSGVNCVQY